MIHIAVAGGMPLPSWAESVIEARAAAEAGRLRDLLGRPTLLIARVTVTADAGIIVGICDKLLRVTRDGLVPYSRPGRRRAS
jgi:hypothetical protein